MEIQFLQIAIATLFQFVLGALWYSPLMFGNLWMQIVGDASLTEAEKAKIQKEMTPFYFLQLILTVTFTLCLSYLLTFNTGLSPYATSLLVWIGIVIPMQVSGVIWGSTKKIFWFRQIAVMSMNQLVGILVSTYILLY
jgi:hypothetical protein